MKGTLLILDDDRSFSDRASSFAREVGFDVFPAGTMADASVAMDREQFDYALIDIGLPDGCGLELLSDARLADTSKIVMSGNAALAAWAGRELPSALGSLCKPFRFSAFRDLLAQKPLLLEAANGPRLLGISEGIASVTRELRAVAPSHFPLLIHGESGTGKELAARLVHELSGRRGRLVTINCAALAPDLIASQLFGHRRGSFTGAVENHAGLIEQAEGGTLFLDEITEAPAGVQAALLRFLEAGEIVSVGAKDARTVDVRVIAATNLEPRTAIAEGRLRADLYFRVAGYEIRMPPLRERPEDVEVIAAAILSGLSAEYGANRRFAEHAFASLKDCPWDGNVRELRQVVQRAWMHGDGALTLLKPHGIATGSRFSSTGQTLDDIEREAILRALASFGDDRAAAARSLGVSTKTIYNKLARYRAGRGNG
jgi:DNA-binding NtrC family response regulator